MLASSRFPTLLTTLLATMLTLSPLTAPAQQTTDPTGRYEPVSPPQPTESPGKVEIVEVFWYGCPHCFSFLPAMEALEKRKAEYVSLRRMPAIFRDSWRIHARAYYTAQLLNKVEAVHRPLFEAIHDKGQRMDNRDDIRALFLANGVDGEAFDKTFDSFAVETLLRKSTVMQGRYGIRGTPSLVVNGKFRVSGKTAGGFEEMAAVAEALAAREHKAMMAGN
jgi:thiol:disulfide interchange protein DsbA